MSLSEGYYVQVVRAKHDQFREVGEEVETGICLEFWLRIMLWTHVQKGHGQVTVMSSHAYSSLWQNS